ncbi:hypothetical protein [Flavobacterium subsaxonicum]|uniref:Uncharacterized protein n=1 Tax=Flavobacterium subsaxonicum WB 4.1-42 = DSM 21790 TaxID=1121898 RepID=A0A0A2MGG9_9FLAO|nr:hypothetical protein [Flavobacterium subsaxonicum]KGO91757.1 hypothetical protein Q766_16075 [Flavobacterium subsaxonicum WB 4.1-42 = DSM 21790]
MYVQGATAEGIRYGAVSPKDYTGLIGWWKASEGVEFSQGSSISKWKDLSGNENHLVPENGQSSAGRLINTVNGVAITRLGAGNYLVCTNVDMHKTLLDGSPNTVIIIMRTNNLTSSVTLIRAWPQIGLNTIIWGINQPDAIPNILSRAYDNTGLKANILSSAPYILPSQGAVYMNVNYGYGSAVVNPYQFFFNNTFKNSAAYSGMPIYVSSNPFSFLPNAAIYMYEIIIYNNTGKTVSQIDYEKDTLYNDYILKQYPNLLL